LLMGRRHAAQIFLPDKWVFPGGRVDDCDRQVAAGFPLSYAPEDLADDIRPFAVAAIRELREETGILIGAEDVPADCRAACSALGQSGAYFPHTQQLRPLARAITPPGRVRRYDTWFFLAPSSAAHPTRTSGDGELLDLDWFSLSEARRLDLPNITRLVLEDIATAISIDADAAIAGVPFYWPDGGMFRRTYTSCRGSQSVP
jgi:8-oxo-dGTP pyrophosphatase MutT (NUDIX family)